MSTTLIIIVAIATAIVAALLASQRSGSRITTIVHRHKKAGEPEDGADA